jgi:hypothetical protein
MIQHFVRLRQDLLEAVTIPFDAWLLGHNRAQRFSAAITS